VAKKSIGGNLPVRFMLASADRVYHQLADDNEALYDCLQIIGETVSRSSKEDLEPLGSAFHTFILKIFNHRFEFWKSQSHEDLKKVEKAALRVYMLFVPKVSESVFKPFFYKFHDWAFVSEGDRTLRAAIFYAFTNQLAETLQSLFTAFASPYIVNNCLQDLDRHHALKAAEKFADAELASCVVSDILRTLSKSFLYDVNSSFATKDRVSLLTNPIVDQITNDDLGSNLAYEERMNDVACCLKFMVRATSENLAVRDLHYKLMLKTRENSPKIRYSALRVMHQLVLSMNEEYLSLLPEAVPFLAELHEDDSDEISNLLKVVFNDIEQIVGEPIANYF
jgi:U3 small nucleolar RNA-associated protein 10